MSALDVLQIPFGICIDFKNPHAYLAITPSLDLCEETGANPQWWSINLPAKRLPEAKQPNEDRGAAHRRIRAEYQWMDLQRQAQACGINLPNAYPTESTQPLAVGLQWVNEHHPTQASDFLSLAFAAYWSPTTAPDVSLLLDELGLPVADFRAQYEICEQALTYLTALIEKAGIFDTPAYIVDGELFYGRAHLPMVRRALGDQTGPRAI